MIAAYTEEDVDDDDDVHIASSSWLHGSQMNLIVMMIT